MNASARLFNCARCYCQVTICQYCDHGNIYCSGSCSSDARRATLHRASARYQASHRGRCKNAERQNRFRRRQREKVTHQGSTEDQLDDLLPVDPETQQNVHLKSPRPMGTEIICHFCRQTCDPFLRNRFLRPPVRHRHRK